MPVLSYPEMARSGDVAVYQLATASAMAPWLAGRAETLVVNYHNVTPPELMAPWDNHLALGQLRAQGDVRLLAPRTTLAVADSVYNEAHLAAAGFTATAVISPSAALDVTTAATTGTPAQAPSRRGTHWLAVGRVSPNKALESTIAALAVARAHGDPEAWLQVIGKPATDSYVTALHRYVADLGLAGAVQFEGHASDGTVEAAYAAADVLVVTSEHEGFCVPVVEAMAAGVPVVAFDQGAVPEVLGGAGVLVSDKDPYALATAIGASAARRDPARWRHHRRAAAPDRAQSRFGRRPLRRPAGPAGRGGCDLVVSGIHQFVPMLHRADAVGRHTLRFRDVAVARGIPSRIYVEMDDPDTASETRPFAHYAEEAAAGDVLVYQFATASAMGAWLSARAEPLVVNYHNVTPPEYYAPWDNGMARHQLLAQTQLRRLGAPCRARPRRVLLQRGGVAGGRFPPHRGGAAGRHGHDRDGAPPRIRRRRSAGGRWISCRPSRSEQGDRVGRHGAARGPGPRRQCGNPAAGGPAGRAVVHGRAAPLRRRPGSP